MNFEDLTLIENASAYVKAAQQDTVENLEILKQHLANPTFRTEHDQHHEALKRAVRANNLSAVTLLLNQTNLDPAIAITPFATEDDDDIQDLCAAVLNAALENANSNIIMLLLRQKPIQDYLRAIPRDNYTFTLLRDMLAEQKNLRAGCEIVQIASQGKSALLPSFILALTPEILDRLTITDPIAPPPLRKTIRRTLYNSEAKFNDVARSIDKQRCSMLHGFKQVTKALGSGFSYYVNDKDGLATSETKSTPALPACLIKKIYDMAISDTDFETSPFSKAQILGIALKAGRPF